MGVTGLWRLIEPVGKPVPVETLENKVLAVDISIWLHQMVKGYQDAKGAPLPNAHLMGLFQRLCKLLYFRIKPVFVFDGGFPDLKRETIGKRQDSKAKYNSESERLKREITLLLGKKTAIGALLGKQIPQKKNTTPESNDDMFKLPALPPKEEESESESEEEGDSSASSIDLHSVDLNSEKFKNLPAKEKYDLLVELKETRKMNSWGKLHTLPKKSENFSDFQMQRLLKRRKVQECLQETEKEMGEGGMSLNDLESLLNEEGIDTKFESLPNRRIASNDTTRYLLISNVRQALAEAKKRKEIEESKQSEVVTNDKDDQNIAEETKTDELEDDLQKAIKMSLECVDDTHDTSADVSKTDESWTSYLSNSDYSDTEDDDGFEQPDMSSAKAYIMQYSDFTHEAIENIVVSKEKDKQKQTHSKVDKILKELDKEKSVIIDKLEMSSTDDDIPIEIAINSDNANSAKVQCIAKESNETCDTSIDSLQASVICVDERNKEIISLDTSTDEENIQNKIVETDNTQDNPNDMKKIRIKENIQTETKPAYKYNLSCSNTTNFHADKVFVAESTNTLRSENISKESESSDDDFEEVIQNDNFIKPVVQLNLNINEEIKDDIFADIFEQDNDSRESIIPPIKSKINNNDTNKSKVETEERANECPQITSLKSRPLELSVTKTQISNMNTTSNSSQDCKKVIEIVDNNEVTNSDVLNKHVSTSSYVDDIKLISKEHSNTIALEIEDKEQDLLQEKGRLDRIGRNITEQMTKEAQELLQLFGIPYIVAPMEAEAQCAFLESVNLTDGTITDDSDIWLFGGKTVYKNFFNQKKHVLQYLSERIEKSFNLSREQLVLLALLVGSDYTTGVNGIGPVTALEVLASFPFNKKLMSTTSKQARYQEIVNGLLEFKKWVRAGKRTDNVSLKKKLKNVKVADDFPSVRVVQAYLDPNVEKSEENFTWGQLDITLLRDYTKTKFGWSQNKLDEIMKPVLKRIQDRKSQKTVHDYFKRKTDFHSLEDQMSKRVKAAVQKMDPNSSNKDADVQKDKPKQTRKRKKPTEKNLADTLINESGPSKDIAKELNMKEVVKVCAINDSNEEKFDIKIRKTQTSQEIIPQRERDKQNILQNKLKAIEAFRKSKIDRTRKKTKRKLPKPKEDAALSESSDSN